MKSKILTLIILSASLFSFVIQPKDNANVNFYEGSFDNFLREARKQDKPVLLDFWASWCGPCKKMDSETFNNSGLATYVNSNFLVYRINIDTFDGMEIAEKYDVDAFPSLLIADKRGNKKEQLKGFYPPNYLQIELKKIQSENNLYPNLTENNIAFGK